MYSAMGKNTLKLNKQLN